jgi:hypothetical protein
MRTPTNNSGKVVAKKPNSRYELLFMDIVGLKINVGYFLIFLYRNMKAVGLELSGAGQNGLLDELEAQEWIYAEIRLLSFKQTIGSTVDIYAQSIAPEKTRSSKMYRHALLLRYLHSPKVFVPLSSVATISSMGWGLCSWRYKIRGLFVITIPIILCVSMLLFTKIALDIRNYINGYFNLYETQSEALPQPRGRGTIRRKRELPLPRFYKEKG